MNKYTKIKDFHGERAKGVGSSDIPILAGLYRSYKKTTFSLWQEKTGKVPQWEGNERTRVGQDLEAYTLARFVEDKFGEDVADKFYMSALRERSWGMFKVKTECRHPERRYCLAHADLLVDQGEPYIDDNGNQIEVDAYIVEAKTVGAYAAKRREGQIFTGYDLDDLTSQGIPDAVFLQTQWQLYTYGISIAYVAALIDNQFHTFGPIKADPRVQEKCLALAERFWNLVQADTPPAPETWDEVAALFPKHTDTTVMVNGDDEQRVREMIAEDKTLDDRAKQIKERREDIENAIGILIGENAVLASGEGDVLAKRSMSTPRASIALADLKKKDPARYSELETIGWIKTGESKPQVRF
jgi:predicted phage-related endonuclease